MNAPLAYFITWTTYGTHLHGDERGSWDRKGGPVGPRFLKPNLGWQRFDERLLAEKPMVFSIEARRVVERAILDHIAIRGWYLHALNVRTNHVHVIVSGVPDGERARDEFKAYGTRRLREARLIGDRRRVWTERGSVVWVWSSEMLAQKIDYVVNQQ